MAWTHIANAVGASDVGVTTLDTSSSLNVAAGDLLVIWAKHEDATTTFAAAKSTGTPTNTFTFDAGDKVDHTNTFLHASFGYLLSAAADATMTVRLTLGASRQYVRIVVMQFRPDAGDTVSKNTSAVGQGTGTSAASAGFSPSGDDLVVCGGFGEFDAITLSSHQINAVAATAVSSGSVTAAWYRILTAGFTNGTASVTASASADWITNGIAFAATGAGGGAAARPSSLSLLGVS